ncbi:MAG: hypothetical protein RL719_1240 [Actinomycetota bacterium]|jgi:tight adherence protein C
MNELSERLMLNSGQQNEPSKLRRSWIDLLTAKPPQKSQRELSQQLADVVELLAAALDSGIGLRDAVSWVSSRCTGRMKFETKLLVDSLEVGESIGQSLIRYESEQKDPALRELALKLALSDQLGTPVTVQLVSFAKALRADALNELRKLGSKKETYLLMPLVFMVLPVTVLFALFPSFQFLQFSSI